MVIINVLVIDYIGIYKVDIGIKGGIIVGIGKVGNLDVMDGVIEGMIVGVSNLSLNRQLCEIYVGFIFVLVYLG